MKQRFALAGALVSLVVLGLFASTATAAPPTTTNNLTVPITGTCQGITGQFTCFTGTFTLTKFVTQGGQLAAQGTLAGTVTNELGQVVGNINQQITIPVSASGTCEILHLELGPLDLNLLGLMVHLDKVVLDITAQSAPGNLLGNLLCAIAHLLDQNAPASQLANTLNQLLKLL